MKSVFSVRMIVYTKKGLVNNEGATYTGRRYDQGRELRMNFKFRSGRFLADHYSSGQLTNDGSDRFSETPRSQEAGTKP